MKSLSQHIDDPIVVGGGDADGRYLTIIFTQEAAARFAPNTKVYLSWRHIQKDVKGYTEKTKGVIRIGLHMITSYSKNRDKQLLKEFKNNIPNILYLILIRYLILQQIIIIFQKLFLSQLLKNICMS